MELVQKPMKKIKKYLIYSPLTENILTEWHCITEEMKYLDIIYFQDTRWDKSHQFHASFAEGLDKVSIIFQREIHYKRQQLYFV